MMTHEPTQELGLDLPEQPTLPFEEGSPAKSIDETPGPEMAPCEVWKALPVAMKTEVRRECLRTMREVLANAPE